MKASLPTFALERPVAVSMISLSLLILGLIAWFKMPLEFLPDIEDPFVGCTIPYPGSTPEQVEQQIAIPAEGEFRTIPGLRRIRTISNSDGCFAALSFKLDTDMNSAVAELRDRIERLKLTLPLAVEHIRIRRFSSQSFPIMAVGVFREEEQEEFVHLVRTVLQPRLGRIEGVADIEVLSPIRERDVLIEFDQDVLRGRNLGLATVIGMLRGGSMNLAVGELRDGQKNYFVRVVGEYRRIEDIASLIVGPAGIRLEEVASVRYSVPDDDVYVSLDGEGGAFLMIKKESEANAVTTCNLVREELERILDMPAFANVKSHTFFDQSQLITGILENLLHQGLYGGSMALIVLFFFLNRVRPTIIVALTIPTSLVVALVCMFFAGMSMNAITMVSMIIAIGMLVDNAIVVVENILRYRRLGYSPKESARRGAAEVGLAILAATTTTWVVFVPIFYMEAGQMSVLMAQLGLPLIISLAGSLLIALTLVPLAMSRIHARPESGFLKRLSNLARRKRAPSQTPGPNRFARVFHLAPIQRTIAAYGHCLGWALRWRLAAILLLAGFIWLTIAVPLAQVGMSEINDLDTRQVVVRVETEQNYDMAMAEDLFAKLEKKLDAQREELGIKNIMTFFRPEGGSLQVYLYTEDDGPLGKHPPFKTDQVMRILSTRLPDHVPGAKLSFSRSSARNSGSTGGVSVVLRGDDTRQLEIYANRFTQIMAGIEDLSEAQTDIELTRQEIQVKVNMPLADKAGVSPRTIGQTVYMALAGVRMPYMKQGAREIPVWAQLREEDRRTMDDLDNVTVQSSQGNLVPLSDLVEYARARSARSIQRVDGKNVVTLTAKAGTEDLSKIRNELRAAANAFQLPAGYSLELGDELIEIDNNLFNFTTTLLMAIVLIYIVMSALFESYLLPLSILSSVPMALGGAIWMLYFTGVQLDTITFIGCVLMSGLIVNNGIVIVDHINTLRKEDLPLRQAIVQAGQDRFRPVMMTAITTILGLIPLAIATTGGAATFAGLGRALIGGLTVGTLLTLFIVPLFYSLIEDFQHWTINFLGNISALQKTAKKTTTQD